MAHDFFIQFMLFILCLYIDSQYAEAEEWHFAMHTEMLRLQFNFHLLEFIGTKPQAPLSVKT